MATINKRINISISKEASRAIALLAKRDALPRATKARHLLEQALEWEEDAVWDALAQKRMQAPRFVSHEKAWGLK
ncbi:MAG: hypothetical protein AAB767_02105 [Patescibacteria group bacterium]